MNHVVPTMGFVIQEDDTTVAFVSDTNVAERIWEVLAGIDNLRAVFLECSFANSHRSLADKSGHLCPELFEHYVSKLPDSVEVIALHLKPCFFDEIARELKCVDRTGLEIGVPGTVYEF